HVVDDAGRLEVAGDGDEAALAEVDDLSVHVEASVGPLDERDREGSRVQRVAAEVQVHRRQSGVWRAAGASGARSSSRSARVPDGTDLAARYEALLALRARAEWLDGTVARHGTPLAPRAFDVRAMLAAVDRPKRRATYEDLMQVPDHKVAEIIDGELFVTPRPASPHAYAATVSGGDL